MSDPGDNSDRLKRRLERERRARLEAEKLLEEKSAELFHANRELERLLEAQGDVLERYQNAMRRISQAFLDLGDDHENNLTRLLEVGADLLQAEAVMVLPDEPPTGSEGPGRRWKDDQAVSHLSRRKALAAREIVQWSEDVGDAPRVHVAIPLEIRLRPVGAVIMRLASGHTFEELDRMVAELIGNGVATELERRETRREMQVKEQEYKTLFHASVDAIIITDFAGRIREVNDSAVTMFGLGRDALLQMKLPRFVARESIDEAGKAFRQLRNAGHCHYEATLLRTDGSRFPADIVGSRFHIDGEARIYGIVRDITMRRKSRAEVVERERKFRTVFERSLDGIVLHDLEGTILDVNETLCKLTGHTKEELLRLSITDLHPPSALETSREAFKAIIQQGRHRFEADFRRRDGSTFTAEVWANTFELGGNTLVQGVVRDITERRKAEREIRDAMEEAEQANETKSLFLATMSHEIRTPLNGILGFAELLAGEKLPEPQAHAVQMIRESGDILLGLINNILDFSRAESGRVGLKDERYDPGKFAQDTAALHRAVATAKGLEIVVEVTPDVPAEVLGNPPQLRQVLMNLIGNAVKFTEAGSVRIVVDIPAPQSLRFSVIDSGVGFPAEDHERIFEAFYQVDRSSTRRHGGTGLGLAICRILAEEMQGTITAASPDPQGARFEVTLPLRLPAPTGATVTIADPTPDQRPVIDGAGLTVLVVEDHPVNARLITLMLENVGFHAEIAGNGSEALDRLRDLPDVSLVLMDMRMPVMDGLEATRRIRAGEAGDHVRDVPVVAVTANVMEADRDACHAVGMDHFLAKPISGREIDKLLIEIGVGVQGSGS